MSQRPARRNEPASSVVAALVVLLAIAAPGGHALADPPGRQCGATNFVAFGPQTYTRAHGRPVSISSDFTILDPTAPYWIRIANGGLREEFGRVSSAVILLNGQVVVGASSFNRNVESIEEKVTLLPQNTLTVELRGAPGSGFSLEIAGYDSGLPTIQFVNPTNGALLDHVSPVFEIVFSDAASGIATGSFRLEVGGNDVTSGASVHPSGASYTPPSPLPEGANSARATVSDNAGHSQATTVDFTVDTVPPQLGFESPANGSSVNSATPTFNVVFSDDVSGVDEGSFLLEVNGVDVTSGASVHPSGASYTPLEPLPEGTGSAWVTVSDRAGNSRSTTVDFTVDTVPPEIRFDTPVSGSTVTSTTPTFNIVFSDGVSGIADGSFRLELNGVDITSSAIQYDDHATFVPAVPLQDGPHSGTATIADRAGSPGSAVTHFTISTSATCNQRGRGTTLDRETARQLAQLSNVAYTLDSPEDPCWERTSLIRSEPGFSCLTALTETAQLVILRDSQNGDLAVALRGSTCADPPDCPDFAADLAAIRADWILDDGTVVPGSVHAGFYCYYQSIRAELLTALLEQAKAVSDPSTARVYFTGHSLGGALAVLAALDLARTLNALGYDRDNIVLYTFGAPRAFTSALQGPFTERVPNHFAVADKEDVVPHVPPAPYVHVRRMAILNSVWPDGSDVEKTRLEFGDGGSYQGCLTLPPVPGPDGARRHTREEYVTRLLPDIVTNELPEISLSVDRFGLMVMHWQGDIQGACDRVALYRGHPSAGGDIALGSTVEWVRTDDDGTQATLAPKSPLHHIAYVDGFDRIIQVVPYEPEVPATLSIEGWGLNNGLLRVNWGARMDDDGLHDFVAVYDHYPSDEGVYDWVRQNNVFNELTNSYYSTTLSMSTRDYWAAYVTSETGSAAELREHPERARILKRVKHDLPALWVTRKDEPWPLKDDLVVRWSIPADGEYLNDFVAIYDHVPNQDSPHAHVRKHGVVLDTDNKWDTNLNWEIGGLWVAYVRQPAFDNSSAYVLTQIQHTASAPQSAPSSTMPPAAPRGRLTVRPSGATSPGELGARDTRFALRALNSIAQLTVGFSLDGEAPATLAVYDVVGRQVMQRQVVSTGPGWRTVQFEGLPSGVYGVRLRQGGRSLSCRAVVVH